MFSPYAVHAEIYMPKPVSKRRMALLFIRRPAIVGDIGSSVQGDFAMPDVLKDVISG